MALEAVLSRTLVELADTLVDDFDVIDLLKLLVDRSLEILGVDAAGLMLVGTGGELRVAASSSEAMRVVELFELQASEGPCLDCHRTGTAVLNEDLPAAAAADGLWPRLAPVAVDAGFRTAHALPMRLRARTIGALNLFATAPSTLDDEAVQAGQALADMATIAILQHEAATEAQLVNQQLNNALTSRVLIEQAKGVLAERSSISMTEAFERLRSYARSHNARLVEVARSLIDGTLAAAELGPRQG